MNEEYSEVFGFPTLGRAAYGGFAFALNDFL